MLIAAVIGMSQSCTCTPPTLSAVDPGRAYPRQIIALDMSGVVTEVVWDAGTGAQRVLPASWWVTPYLQVPENASPGPHPVAVRNPGGMSMHRTVTVLASSGTFPPPRMQSITIFDVKEQEATLDIVLTVAVANVDMLAKLFVNNAEVPTLFHCALPVPYLLDHDPATFGYPVYHYGQLAGIVKGVKWGDPLEVVVKNTDGQATDLVPYWLPTSAAELDRDGDGLTDVQETSTTGLNLPSLGVHPLRRDLLVEVDWMDGAAPDPAAWPIAEAVFADAPVLNPDGSTGIHLIVDRGQGGAFTGGGDVLPASSYLGFGPSPAASSYADFYDFKSDAALFATERFKVFRYCVLAFAMTSGQTGQGEIGGDDFFTALADDPRWATPRYQAAVFVHELGHALNLRHGGLDPAKPSDDVVWEYKPNVPSAMNYRYMFEGVSVDGDLTPDEPPVYTFSEGQLRVLDESTIDEKAGILDDKPLDLNGNGSDTETTGMDLNGDGSKNRFHDYDQWGRLLVPVPSKEIDPD